MEDDLEYQKGNISATTGRIFPNFTLRLLWPKQTLQMFQMKKTSIRIWPLMEDYLNYQKWNISATTGPQILNLILFDQIKSYKYFNWRKAPMDDNLKYQKWNISTTPGWISLNLKLKVNWPNKSLHMFQLKMTSNGRQLKLSKVKNLSSYCLILPQFQNWCLSEQTKYYKCF